MENENVMIILFGATGDLAKRKLIPALQKLQSKGFLKNNPVICVGRRKISQEEYLKLIEVKGPLANQIFYSSVNIEKKEDKDFVRLVKELDEKYKCKGNRAFYLALSADLFKPTIELIKDLKLVEGKGKKRIAFEKPFGKDLKSAEELNKAVSSFFKEEEIYRVDHYLGKELVENITVFRFANALFEDIWNNQYIESVQIILSESTGIEERAEYYDQSGAIRDMVQNHILQILSLLAMEAPKNFEANAIRDEKVRVLKSLEKVKAADLVTGQYTPGSIDAKSVKGYLEEANVAKDSKTETFVALKAFINNERWEGVPFFIKTGKRLGKKYSEANIVLKDIICNLFCEDKPREGKNVISIRIHPQEGIAIRFNAKTPDSRKDVEPVFMEFSHKSVFGPNTPEAYETLLKEMISGNQTLFTRWDEIKESWIFVDDLLKKKKNVIRYNAGSDGPKEADELLKIEGKEWITTQ